jgi:hypothetical protein
MSKHLKKASSLSWASRWLGELANGMEQKECVEVEVISERS